MKKYYVTYESNERLRVEQVDAYTANVDHGVLIFLNANGKRIAMYKDWIKVEYR